MKGYKKIVPIALVVCMLLSFYMLINTRLSTKNNYNTYLSAARSYAKQGIAVDAIVNYEKALEIKNTIDLNIEVGNFYVKMNDVIGSVNWGERMIDTFPKSSKAYLFLLKRYRSINDFNRCYTLYQTIVKKRIETKSIRKIMDGIKYIYYYGEGYDDVAAFSEGYCAVEYEGEWGLADEVGRKTAPTKFKTVGSYIDELAPVTTEDGDAYYIDSEGNKKMVVKTKGKVVALRPIVNGVFAVNNGKKWAFYNKEYKKISPDYSDVSLLANGFVAVEKDSQWLILNDKFEPINNKKYTQIVQDERNIICRNGVIFVNDNGDYLMMDTSGKEITNKKFLDAKLFLDNTYAAVKTEKGWTFVDSKGEFVFKDAYFEEANSFRNGFAAVKKNGAWGYINTDGELAIKYQFRGAKDFNSNGCAFVKNEDAWQLLRLYSSNYES